MHITFGAVESCFTSVSSSIVSASRSQRTQRKATDSSGLRATIGLADGSLTFSAGGFVRSGKVALQDQARSIAQRQFAQCREAGEQTMPVASTAGIDQSLISIVRGQQQGTEPRPAAGRLAARHHGRCAAPRNKRRP
jgi:hypothetical protein